MDVGQCWIIKIKTVDLTMTLQLVDEKLIYFYEKENLNFLFNFLDTVGNQFQC